MLKVGTIFSGIGAFEQALKRLDVQHEILFACDNGDINIDVDYEKELKYIKTLKTIEDKKNYVYNLYKSKSKKTNFVKVSYDANYKIKDDNFFYDVKLFDGLDFKNKVDILVGGSPCQSFSIVGSRGGFEDARGTLFYDYCRLIHEIKPKVFIYENVFGVLNHDKGKTWLVMKECFDNLNYFWKYQVLDSRDYGIPQGRRRVFIVGFLDKEKAENFSFPNPIDLEFTMQDFLIDNVKFGYLQNRNNKLTILKKIGEEVPDKYYLSEKLKRYVLSPGTKNFIHHNAETDLKIARALLSTQGNTHRASVNNYVTSKKGLRSLTERETHRLMGFPDSYNIIVSKAQAFKQSGNSIVVDVLMHIYKEIERCMSWKE